jgi:hypothetical protein
MPEDKTPSRKPAVKKPAAATKKPPAAAQAPTSTKPAPRSGAAAKTRSATPTAPVAKKVATAAPTSSAAAGKPAAAKTGAGATGKTSPATVVAKPAAPPAEERQRWIAIAAYHRAEQRGFTPGYELQDGLEAEAEIGALIGKA